MMYLHNSHCVKPSVKPICLGGYFFGIMMMGLSVMSTSVADETFDLPCDQMFYKAATSCDFEGVAEANAMIACLSLKLAHSGCELEIQQLEEVDECGLGCAPVWVLPDKEAEAALHVETTEQNNADVDNENAQDYKHSNDQVAQKQVPQKQVPQKQVPQKQVP